MEFRARTRYATAILTTRSCPHSTCNVQKLIPFAFRCGVGASSSISPCTRFAIIRDLDTTASSCFEGAPEPRYFASCLSHTLPQRLLSVRHRPPVAEHPPHLCSAGRHPQSGGCGDRVPAQGEARADAGDDRCCCRAKIHLLRVALFASLVIS